MIVSLASGLAAFVRLAYFGDDPGFTTTMTLPMVILATGLVLALSSRRHRASGTAVVAGAVVGGLLMYVVVYIFLIGPMHLGS